MSLLFRVHYMVTLPARDYPNGFVPASTFKGEPILVGGIHPHDAEKNARVIMRQRHGPDARLVVGKIKRAGDTSFSKRRR